MNSPDNGIDIIIPIYNAYDDIKLCIESIKKNTNLKENRVILVNDKSTDERILPYLKSQETNNIILIDSKINEGFSASINKGILCSNKDVILLNSDTIVTNNWVEKIKRCAYSKDEIGTVTPISNSATLCSVPVFCEDNSIPNDMTIEEFGNLIEFCSLKKYPQITVAVGFCMYIKRVVIECVGTFDVKTFEKGYGEENDFCNRAEQYGYIHVMCDDTFIFHKGTSSFPSEEKIKLIKKHEEILYQRYNRQMVKNHKYCMDNPDQIIRDNINIYLKLKNKKKNVLYFVHSDFHKDASDNIGGTQFHVKDLAIGLKEDFNIFVVSRDLNNLRVTAYLDNDSISFKFDIGNKPEFSKFTDHIQKNIYSNILKAFSIDLVHIHHTYGLSLDMFYLAKSLKVPLILTLHDYYYVCPTIKLLNYKNVICTNIETRDMCEKCLRLHYDIAETVDYIPKWRVECEKAMLLCDKIIVPSNNTKDIYLKYYPSLEDKIDIIEHGSDKLSKSRNLSFDNIIITEKCKIHIESLFIEKDYISGWAYIEDMDSRNTKIHIEITDKSGFKEVFLAKKIQRSDVADSNNKYLYSGFICNINSEYFNNNNINIKIILENGDLYTNGQIFEHEINLKTKNKNLNVAFIGGLNAAKGSELVYNIVKNDKNCVNWYIFGNISDYKLNTLSLDNLVKTGEYEKENLSKLIERFKIDIICILPIWNETFCYTLSEALLCKKPVIVTDIGAVGERVRKMKCGWSLPLDSDYSDYLELIYKINKYRDEYEKKLQVLKEINIKSVTEMLMDYSLLYKNYLNSSRIYAQFDTNLILDSYLKAINNNSFLSTSDYYTKLCQLEMKLQEIELSTTYKLAVKLRYIKIPFKMQIKKIMLKGYRVMKRIAK